MKALSGYIRDVRIDLGCSQREFAKALGLGKNGYRFLQRIEKGEAIPSGNFLTLVAYMDKYGIDNEIMEIWDEEPDNDQRFNR